MVADERHKSAAFQHLSGKGITALFDEPQFLMFRISHGENHAAALGKLGKERLRNCRSGSRNKDGVERSEFRQADFAIAAEHRAVGAADAGKLGGSNGSKLPAPLDGENFLAQT